MKTSFFLLTRVYIYEPYVDAYIGSMTHSNRFNRRVSTLVGSLNQLFLII